MQFSELAGYLNKLEQTSSRIEMTKILAELFEVAPEDEIAETVNLLLGQLAPSYKSIVFNIAEKMMILSIAEAYGLGKDEVTTAYKSLGDLGDVAFEFSRKSQKSTKNLNVKEVFSRLTAIAGDEGEGSQERKIVNMAKLLSSLDSPSARYAARIPIGKLRLGFSDKTIIDALSWMVSGDKSQGKKLTGAYEVRPDIALLAQNVKKVGIEKATENKTPEIGIPVGAMLAQRIKSPKTMIEKMGKVSVEPKLDGLRIQIHFKNGEQPKTFTRNLNDTSWMFPELFDLPKYLNATEVILDSEAVGVDESLKKMANFQTTMTRRRKHEIEETASKIGITFYVFDILYKDGKSLMEEDYLKRREVLEKTVKEGELLKIVSYEITDDPEQINKLNLELRDEGLEGIMVKKIDSKYIPGRTGWRWVKMKESEKALGKLADTVDCVIMGFSAGLGKRSSFGVGQFLAGVVDGEKIKTITKVGTGLTDEQFQELFERLQKIKIKEKPEEYEVHKDLEPDFWVSPSLVVELAADEITKSPKHAAGVALRFPRLVKFRDDKSFSQATTLSEIKEMQSLA